MTPQELSRIVRGESSDQEHLRELEQRRRQSKSQRRGIKEGVDPKNLSQAGWGVIYAHSDKEKLELFGESQTPALFFSSLHTELVKQALMNRIEIVKAMTSATSSLVEALKILEG
jgi:hypothetical protein